MVLEERAPYLAALPDEPKLFRRAGLGYLFAPRTEDGVSVGVQFFIDSVKRRAGGMMAELVVDSTLPGVPARVYGPANCNLLAPTTLKSLATDLAEVAGIGQEIIPWRKYLNEFAVSVIEAERRGEPFEQVSDTPPSIERTFTVASLVPDDEPTLIYAPWASGKGWLCSGLAVSVATGLPFAGLNVRQGAVLYCDWEDKKKNWDLRMWAITRALNLSGPPKNLYYRRCSASLSGQVNQLALFIAEHNITLLIIDSMGLAIGSVGERGTYEEAALTLFEGLRHVGATQVLIDHMNEQGRQSKEIVGKSYGSIYKMALVRNAWEVRKEQALGTHTMSLGLYHTKCNHGPLLAPVGIDIDFTEPGITKLERGNVGESVELSGRLPAHERIAIALADRGPMFTKEIAKAVDLPENQVRVYLDRHERDKGRKLFAKLPDGRWEKQPERTPPNGHLELIGDEYGRVETDEIPF